MRVLITGASGYIGTHVVERLRNDVEVVAFVRNAKPFPAEGVRAVEGSMENAASLMRATRGIDVVVHLAAAKSDEKNSREVNVGGARRLVEACKQNRVKGIVVMSTASAKLPRKGLYGATKEAADKIFLASGIPTTILRPSVVYGVPPSGVFASLLSYARLPFVPVIGDGSCIFYPIHVEDLAELVRFSVKNANTHGKIYDIGGPDALSLDTLIRRIAHEMLGKQHVPIVHIPVGLGLFLARAFSFLPKPPITVSNILGSTQNIPWNPEPMRNDFAVNVRPLDEGFTEMKKASSSREPAVIFRYLYARSPKAYRRSPELEERYLRALKAHDIEESMSPLLLRFPALIGPLDALLKFRRRENTLEQRLQIGSALLETDVQSAPWLLPKQRGIASLLFTSGLISFSAGIKLVVGLFLSLIPGFIQNHAR